MKPSMSAMMLPALFVIACSGAQYNANEQMPGEDGDEEYTEEELQAYYEQLYGEGYGQLEQGENPQQPQADEAQQQGRLTQDTPPQGYQQPQPTAGKVDCQQVVQKVVGSSGCQMTIVGPTNCAELDFSPGFVEFAWTTDGTFCEGPHKFFLGGHPSNTWETGNSVLVEINSTGGDYRSVGNHSQYTMTRNLGGLIRMARADLHTLTTTTGQYHWGVMGFYEVNNGGSITGTATFTVGK